MRISSNAASTQALQPKPADPGDKRRPSGSTDPAYSAGTQGLLRAVQSAGGSAVEAAEAGAVQVSQAAAQVADAAEELRQPVLDATEPGVLTRLGSWVADSVLGLFVSAASRQLGEVASAAWDGIKEIATKTAEFVVNGTVLVVGAGLSAVQTACGLEAPGREVNGSERRALNTVFGEGLDQDRLVLKQGFAGIASINDRPFTLGNTVYLKDRSLPPDASASERRTYESLLVHEAVHAWQHQHGNTPIANSIWNDNVVGDAYNWQRGLNDESKSFAELNVEQQAEFISDAYRAGYFEHPESGFQVGGVDYTCQLEQALRLLRRVD